MKIETQCIHEGYKPQNGQPLVLPVCQSTTFYYESAEQLSDLFDLSTPGHIYSRISNPTLGYVEDKIAALEGGRKALLASTGQAAALVAICTICAAGDHVVSSNAIYGGVMNLFGYTLKKLGIDFTFVDPSGSDEEIQKAFRPNTKALFGETLSNPTLRVLDIEKFARVAHSNNVPLIVDNTFATPILCRPIEHGADIVMHSTSKFMDGHAAVLGGVLVDAGRFDWTNGRFPGFTEPDESYHGVVYTNDFPEAPFVTKARVQTMRDFGAVISPMAAFILNYGMETLHLRMERHSENALAVAKCLQALPGVAWVNYPMLHGDGYDQTQHQLRTKYLPKGCGGVLSFGLTGGRQAAMEFMNKLRLIRIVTHVADVRTGVLHPASTTHRQLNDQQLKDAGISEDLIRLSIGIEHVEDILEDVKQALA